MTHYIYPQNLKASANMWLWSLRDFAIMGVAALLSIVILVELHLPGQRNTIASSPAPIL